ncbi:hypothetical protein POMI540_4397 [Schizosaccharomyces pombe]
MSAYVRDSESVYSESYPPENFISNEPEKSKDKDNFNGEEVISYVGEVETVPAKEENVFRRFINGFKIEKNQQDSAGQGLKRRLKSRHIQMIGIGGAIGTGVWVGSSKSLYRGGAASVLIDYCIVGTMVFCTVYALGELAVAFPTRGSFVTHATRFIDESWGFALSWNYVFSFIVTIPLELTTGTMMIKYWTNLNSGIWVTVFIVFLFFINIFGVKGYGEMEFIMSTIKVVAMCGFIILGIIIDCGGVPTDHRGYMGTHIFRENAFRHKFKGFCAVFTSAAFSFSGTEYVGVAAAETENPAKAFPVAVRQTLFRIAIFYILSLFIVSLLISGADPRLTSYHGVDASPFVLAIKDANIKALPSILNAIILISVISSANAQLYAGSRAIHSLGCNGFAPKCFTLVDREGRPLVALLILFLFMFLGYLVETGQYDTVFDWMLSISGLGTLFCWGSICLAHIRYRAAMKHQNRSLKEVGFVSPFNVYASYYAFILVCLVLAAEFYVSIFPVGGKPDASAFFENYLSAPVILVFFICHKLYYKTKRITLSNMDLETDFAYKTPVEEEEEEKSAGSLSIKQRMKKLSDMMC